MLKPRIIPCLLVHNKGLVKTVNFKDPKYLGDPINAVRIFNEKEVDELIVLDIDCSRENRPPDYKMIEDLAAECRMPLCYGGGVKSADDAQRIFNLGVEKVAISSAAVENPNLIAEIAQRVGTQSVIIVLDVKKGKSGYEVWTYNGTRNSGRDVVDFAKQVESLGAGEVVINYIDNDGKMQGYDFDLIDQVREAIGIPITVLGGAGTLQDIGELIDRYEIIGAAAGSLFVFKGKFKAVLISYPSHEQKSLLFKNLTRKSY